MWILPSIGFLLVGICSQPLVSDALIANLLKYIYRVTSRRAIEAKFADTSVAERHGVIDIYNEKVHLSKKSGRCC
jgi:hypothetical protein